MATKREPVDILGDLIQRALEQAGWNADTAASEAKRRKIKGLSAHNIRDYVSEPRRRKRRPSPVVIRRFARLFGESEESWLSNFPDHQLDPLLLTRERVIADQNRLEDGDEVFLVSSKPFLEAADEGVSRAVLQNLDRGIAYTYYFPTGPFNPYGEDASVSYGRFRNENVAPHRFFRSPLLFGYSVDPKSFPYFSALHTIVHYSARTGASRTYVYIEPVRGHSENVEPHWYLITEAVWNQIATSLRESRSFVADLNLPILPLNPHLPGVQGDYVKWFKRDDSVDRYHALRPVLGHAGDRCVRALLSEVGSTRWQDREIQYLDIGCGDGEITAQIADLLARQVRVKVVGIDISRAQVQRAKQSLKGTKATTFAIEERAIEEFRSEQSFNLITAVHSLYTVDEAYLRRVYELLAPNGIACIWMARREANVVTAVCNAIDEVLRPGQCRNTAEDIERYARCAGLSFKTTSYHGAIPKLLDDRGTPTKEGQRLIDFCALQSIKKGTKAWQAAVDALRDSLSAVGVHQLTDALIVLHRRS